jgi:hypothetical protein
MLAHKVPGGLTHLEKTDIQEVLISHVAEVTEEKLEEPRVLNELLRSLSYHCSEERTSVGG